LVAAMTRERRNAAASRDSLELAVLENAQKLGLQLQGQLADLIQKQRSVARILEITRLFCVAPVNAPLV